MISAFFFGATRSAVLCAVVLCACSVLTACDDVDSLGQFELSIEDTDRRVGVGDSRSEVVAYLVREQIDYSELESDEVGPLSESSSPPLSKGAVSRIIFFRKENNSGLIQAGMQYLVDIDKDGNVLAVSKVEINSGP